MAKTPEDVLRELYPWLTAWQKEKVDEVMNIAEPTPPAPNTRTIAVSGTLRETSTVAMGINNVASSSLETPAACIYKVGDMVRWQGQTGLREGLVTRITEPEPGNFVLWLDDFPLNSRDATPAPADTGAAKLICWLCEKPLEIDGNMVKGCENCTQSYIKNALKHGERKAKILASTGEPCSRFDTKGHPAVATIQKFANQLKNLALVEPLVEHYEARKAFEELDKMFLLDLGMYSWPSLLDALKKHLRQPKLTDEKDDLSNSGKAFIEINQMLGTLRMFEDWPSLIKALKERLNEPPHQHIPNKSQYVFDRLKELQKDSGALTHKQTILDSIVPLMTMLAEDLSEFKKSLDSRFRLI